MTEMEITYVFIRYISVTIKRQAKAFYNRHNKVYYYENKEFIESIEIEERTIECHLNSSSFFYGDFEEKMSYQDLLCESLNSLDEIERRLLYEKYLNQRSDVDIGNDYSISSQMVSRRKRKILDKLRKFFFV